MLAIPPPMQNPPNWCFKEIDRSLQAKILIPAGMLVFTGLVILFVLQASYDESAVKLGKDLFLLCPISLFLFGIMLSVVLLWGKLCKKVCGNHQQLILRHAQSTDSGLSGDLNPPTPEMPRVILTNSRDSGINMELLD